MKTYFEYTRAWWDFAFDNPEKVKPIHSAVYLFALEHCNRLGWKQKYGLPSSMVMEAIGVKKWHTYINAFNDLCEWGFFKLIQKSKNQYSSNIISLEYAMPKKGEALDKALAKHGAKHGTKHGTKQGQYNNTTDNIQQTDIVEQNSTLSDFIDYINSEHNRNFKITENVKRAFNARIKQYDIADLLKVVDMVYADKFHIEKKFKYATPEYCLRPDQVEKWLNYDKKESGKFAIIDIDLVEKLDNITWDSTQSNFVWDEKKCMLYNTVQNKHVKFEDISKCRRLKDVVIRRTRGTKYLEGCNYGTS